MRGNIDTVMGFVLMAILLIVGIVIMKVMVFSDTQDYVACAAEIRTHSAIIEITDGVGRPTITCPTKRIVTEAKTSDNANKILAEQMKKCWSAWGRGELDLFGKNNDASIREGVFCHVCSTVAFEDLESIEGLPKYLDTHNVGEETYAQYLSGTKTGLYFSQEQIAPLASASMSTKQPVAIIFTHAKGQFAIQRLYNQLVPSPGTGFTLGTVAGAAVGIGILVISSEVTVPLVALSVGTTATGSVGGLAFGAYGTKNPSTMSAVVARPLTKEGIEALGCKYDPVANR